MAPAKPYLLRPKRPRKAYTKISRKLPAKPLPDGLVTTIGEKWSTNKPTLEYLGLDVVHIKVGKELKDFGIHKSLICHHSPFFEKAFSSNYEEGKTDIMKMEDTDAEIFGLFYTWLYTPVERWLDEFCTPQPSQKILCQLYVFADMIQAAELTRFIFHTFYAYFIEHPIGEPLSSPGLLNYVWDNTGPSSVLRRVLIDFYVWRIDFETVFAEYCAPAMTSELCSEIIRALARRAQYSSAASDPLLDIENYEEAQTSEEQE